MRKYVYDFLSYVLNSSRHCTWVKPKTPECGDVAFTPEVGDFIMSISSYARKHFHAKLCLAFEDGKFKPEEFENVFTEYVKNAPHLCRHTVSLHVCNLFGFAAEAALMFMDDLNFDGINMTAELIFDQLLPLFKKKFSTQHHKVTMGELIFTEFLMCTRLSYELDGINEYYRRKTIEEIEESRTKTIRAAMGEDAEMWDEVLDECQMGKYWGPQREPDFKPDPEEYSSVDVAWGTKRDIKEWKTNVLETWAFVDAFVKHLLKLNGIKWQRKSGKSRTSKYFTNEIGDGIIQLSKEEIDFYESRIRQTDWEYPLDINKFCERFYNLALHWSNFRNNGPNFLELCWLFAFLATSAKTLHTQYGAQSGDEAIETAANLFSSYFVSEMLFFFLRKGGYPAFTEFIEGAMLIQQQRDIKMKRLHNKVEKVRNKTIKRIKKRRVEHNLKWQEKFLEASPSQKISWARELRWRLPASSKMLLMKSFSL